MMLQLLGESWIKLFVYYQEKEEGLCYAWQANNYFSQPHEKSLGCNPLSDAPYRNPDMVLNR
jgi:hypothetical protein